MSFPRYPEYKDSGVAWLGEVPAHWEVKPLKKVAYVINGYPFDSKLFSMSIGFPLVRIRDLNKRETESRYTGEFIQAASISADDVLIGMDGDFNVGRWLGEGQALLNQRMCCIRAETPLLKHLLEYLLPIPLKALNEVTYATTVKHLSSIDVGKFRIAIPSDVEEQSAIVAFLDGETAKIDALVTEQQRLIELLQEKRQAVISHAVTKGLNPDAPMKPSGVEWLGEVPAHWEVVRMGNVFHEVAEPGIVDLPVLSVSIHHGVSDKEMDDDEMERKITRIEDRSKYKRVAPNDLVYNMMRAWQGGFGSVEVDGLVSPAYVVARPRQLLITKFVEYLIRTPQAIEQMRRYSAGVTDFRLRLYWDEFKNIRIALPPYGESKAICAKIEEVQYKINALIEECQKSIELLQERRQALISAAVTGQIDVRTPEEQTLL